MDGSELRLGLESNLHNKMRQSLGRHMSMKNILYLIHSALFICHMLPHGTENN